VLRADRPVAADGQQILGPASFWKQGKNSSIAVSPVIQAIGPIPGG
jgi:hypothetical protein